MYPRFSSNAPESDRYKLIDAARGRVHCPVTCPPGFGLYKPSSSRTVKLPLVNEIRFANPMPTRCGLKQSFWRDRLGIGGRR